MKNTKNKVGSFATAKPLSLLAIIALVAVMGFTMTACDDGGGGGEEPEFVGVNEVVGKTIYLSYDLDEERIEFAGTGTTFTRFNWVGDESTKGVYQYNSEKKTITLITEQIYVEGEWKAKAQYPQLFETVLNGFFEDPDLLAYLDEEDMTIDEFIAEESGDAFSSVAELKAYLLVLVDIEFATVTYDYIITDDDTVLVNAKLPANAGSNQLSGKTLDYYLWDDYTFNSDGTFLLKSEGDFTGTYAYNSTHKLVYTRTEATVWGEPAITRSISETYEHLIEEDWYDTPEENAGVVNSIFQTKVFRYDAGSLVSPYDCVDFIF